MTWQRWSTSSLCFLLALGAFWYAVHAIKGAWGMVVLAGVFLVGGAWVVNTFDLLFGRWIRRGPNGYIQRSPTRVSAYPPQTRVIRRVILEEIELED